MSYMAYVIMRVEPDGGQSVVHQAEKIKDARYWLTYIAKTGDAMCLSPSHPKYSGDGKTPIYQAHLVSRGKISYDQAEWKKQVALGDKGLTLPEGSGAVAP